MAATVRAANPKITYKIAGGIPCVSFKVRNVSSAHFMKRHIQAYPKDPREETYDQCTFDLVVQAKRFGWWLMIGLGIIALSRPTLFVIQEFSGSAPNLKQALASACKDFWFYAPAVLSWFPFRLWQRGR